MSVLAKGADFSSYQSDSATLAALRHGLHFGLVKLTQGTEYVNPRARLQTALLREHGARVGLYHFLIPDVNGVAQWDHFERWSYLGLPAIVAVDHEPDEHGRLPADDIVRAFIRRGQQRGFRVGRYGSSGLTMQRKLGEDWRWVARWASAPPAGAWDVWQFSTAGGQDWDVFRGSPAQLAEWWTRMARLDRPQPRWWIHDGPVALGPLRLATLGPRLIAYAARHPRSSHYTIARV